MERLAIAYSLIAIMVAAAAALIAYRVYYSRLRVYHRRTARESVAYAQAQDRRRETPVDPTSEADPR